MSSRSDEVYKFACSKARESSELQFKVIVTVAGVRSVQAFHIVYSYRALILIEDFDGIHQFDFNPGCSNVYLHILVYITVPVTF